MLRCCLLLVMAWAASAADLRPGGRWEVPMPELGATSDGGRARVGIKLPSDYDAKRSHPAIVWFGGGMGGSNPDEMHRIIGGTGFVIIAVPYKEGILWGSPLSWYMPMLERAFAEVPNINRKVLVTAGFSSGGGATGIATFTKEGMDLFCAAIPAGLSPHNGFKVVDHPRFAGFPILAIMGADDSSRVGDMRKFCDTARKTAVDLTYVEMPGVGHSWDPVSYPQVRAFLREKVLDRQRALFIAAMDAAMAKKRPAQAIPLIRSLAGLCPEDHPDAIHAREVEAQVTAQAEQAYAALGEQAKPKAMMDFLAVWAGTAPGDRVQARYDALAAADPAPVQPDGAATGAKLGQWVKDVAKYTRKWPDSSAARAIQGEVDQRLGADLDALLAQEAGAKRNRALLAFAKAFPEQPAGKRAVEELQRLQAEHEQQAKPSP